MENIKLLWIFAFVYCIPLLHAQIQIGFISIDCGSSPNSVYTEKKTGINYTSDENFTDEGVNYNISTDYISESLEQPFHTVRSFPEESKNCYTLKPDRGYVKFLIRASFMYGNYDGKNQTPGFSLLLGTDEWDSVELHDASNIVHKEIIHAPKRSRIDVCLVNTGSGTPFISSLELRPLLNESYHTQSDVSLLLHLRWDIGSTANPAEAYRFKDDIYDRIWSPHTLANWIPLSTRLKVNNDMGYGYGYEKPPSEVMQTAAMPANGGDSLELDWNSNDPETMFYVTFYFADFNETRAEKPNRIQSIYLNGTVCTTFPPPYLISYTLVSPVATSGERIYSIKQDKRSVLPPIINAFESFASKQFRQLFSHDDDVDSMIHVKREYGVKRNWQGDPCVPPKYIWQGLNCSYPDDALPRITFLNLSYGGISGVISPHISGLILIQSLDLSYNNLTGPVPDFLSLLPYLTTLNLRGNHLQGSVPAPLVQNWESHHLALSVDGNPDLCLSNSCDQKIKTGFAVVPILASFLAVLALVAAISTLYILKIRSQGTVWRGSSGRSLDPKSRRLSYAQVLKITNNFERIIGQGGFGTVYHGILDDNEVPVKMLSASSVQGYKQFQTEVELLLRIHHKNLTTLIGYCDDQPHVGLIYEFMANGNVESHLLDEGSNAGDILSWEGRLRIATEAAQGLEYLHSGCRPPIIHRDVKPSNILLNKNFQAKMADFGLSRIFPSEDGTHVSTNIVGTPGYLDPEYYRSNRLTEKSDVYSFGVVLLQLITSKRAIVNSVDRTHIVQWMRSAMHADGEIGKVVDQRLQGNFNINSAWRAVEVALACVSENSAQRPTMNQVLIDLSESLAIQISPRNFGYEGGSADATRSSSIGANPDSVSGPLPR